MAVLKRTKMDLHDKAIFENLEAENEDMKAFIAYNVMMGNIEDPSEEEEEAE